MVERLQSTLLYRERSCHLDPKFPSAMTSAHAPVLKVGTYSFGFRAFLAGFEESISIVVGISFGLGWLRSFWYWYTIFRAVVLQLLHHAIAKLGSKAVKSLSLRGMLEDIFGLFHRLVSFLVSVRISQMTFRSTEFELTLCSLCCCAPGLCPSTPSAIPASESSELISAILERVLGHEHTHPHNSTVPSSAPKASLSHVSGLQ